MFPEQKLVGQMSPGELSYVWNDKKNMTLVKILLVTAEFFGHKSVVVGWGAIIMPNTTEVKLG